MQQSCFIFLFLLFACAGRQHEAKEEGFQTTESGFHYKIIRLTGGADTLQKGDVAKIHLRQYIDDSLLNDTHEGMPVYVKIDSALREFDFTEILPLMKVNDSAVCIFPTKEILKRASAETYPPNFLNRGENIKVLFKVIKRFSSDTLSQNDYLTEQRRNDSLANLKERAGYKNAAKAFDSLIKPLEGTLKKLPNGVYVQVLNRGTGPKIKKGDSVAVIYKGMLANGTLFESTTAQKPFVIKAGQGDAIEGFDSGIAALSFGDKAKIFIPAQRAYGGSKAGNNIPAFSNLVFEVVVNKP